MGRALVALALLGGGLALWWMSREAPAPARSLEELVARAETLYARNDHASSALLYGRIAELAREAGDERMAVAYDAQQGVCLKMDDRPSEAREKLLPALEAARRFGDKRTEGLALGNLARVEGMEHHDDLAIDYLEQLAALAEEIDDPRLASQTLEQAAMLSLTMGHGDEALARIDRALEVNQQNQGEDDRRDALLRQRATILVQLGDDEGAVVAWGEAAPAPAAMANQALLLADLGLHDAASDLALEASLTYEQDGADRRGQRDQALLLALSEQLRAGQHLAVAERLSALLASGAEPAALARFRVVEGRLALAEGRTTDAVEALTRARNDLGATPDAEPVGWLLAVALLLDGRTAEADTLLEQLPASLARTLVWSWGHAERPPDQGLALDHAPALAADADPGDDRSLAVLTASCPVALPSLAWSALHHHLADADRLRGSGRDDLAEDALRRGVTAALRWQVLEARRHLTGRWPEGGVPASTAAWIDAWVAGSVSPDEALLMVLPGEPQSYLVLCNSSFGATTFGAPSEQDLSLLVGAVTGALRSGDRDQVAQPAARLFAALFGKRARIDLEDRSRWTLILPDVLAAAPPALWVEQEPLPGQPVPWLVRRRVLGLLPHAPLPRVAPGQREGLVQVGEALVDTSRSALVVPAMTQRYGDVVLAVGSLRADAGATRLAGSDATVEALAQAAASCQVLEASVAALGGGRLAGLLLTPDDQATRGDARAGVLPWPRLAQLDLPPLLILDRSRFDPGDREHGMASAAAATAGAPWSLLSRWPLPAAIRERQIMTILDAFALGIDPAQSLAAAQREWLAAAEDAGRVDLENPRHWAAFTVWGGP